MTAEEFCKILHEVVEAEMQEINERAELKGVLDSFNQGRSFELGVIEGSMSKIRKEAEDGKSNR